MKNMNHYNWVSLDPNITLVCLRSPQTHKILSHLHLFKYFPKTFTATLRRPHIGANQNVTLFHFLRGCFEENDKHMYSECITHVQSLCFVLNACCFGTFFCFSCLDSVKGLRHMFVVLIKESFLSVLNLNAVSKNSSSGYYSQFR